MPKRPSRRAFVQVGASTVLGLSAADLLRLRADAAADPSPRRARSVVLLWLWGGPSHIDTFDPKPQAPSEYRGPFSTIATRVPGLAFCELFPELARRSDQFALVRSLHTTSNDHGVAGTIGLTGVAAGAVDLGGKSLNGAVRPALGAMVARAGRSDAVNRANMAPFVVIGDRLHQGKKAIVGEGGGTLGGRYDPFRVQYDQRDGAQLAGLELIPGISTSRLEHRGRLRKRLNQLQTDLQRVRSSNVLDDHFANALAMLTDHQSLEMFDLSQESARLRDRYGRTRFGQSCLIARRLVEYEVPFVQVNWSSHVEPEEDAGDGGWDLHYRNFQIMQDRHAAWLDQSFSALLDDLADRRLLDQTLVIAVGEFGRTPKINKKAGRDHWEHCYCAAFAGAGVQGGRVLGASDARGEKPVEMACTPADIVTTVQRAVGISSEQAQSLGMALSGRELAELY